MATRKEPEAIEITLRFGGGIHSRASEDEIDIRECVQGENFDLDIENKELKNRKPFDLIGQLPNAQEIRGFVTLLKSDGTSSFLVQSGSIVYQWLGGVSFVQVGSVDSSAKIRGRKEHNWTLDDRVIITDINLIQPVMEWDGTTLSNISFTNELGASFGTFRARYCAIKDERVVFANIHDNGANFQHLIVGSKRSNYKQITVVNKPASDVSEEDPFYMIQPDLKPVNSLVKIFGLLVTSSKSGDLFKIIGDSSQNFGIQDYFSDSGARGDEALTQIGNDVIYGRAGRIESLADTDRSGDVETNDLTLAISDLVKDYNDWLIVYNSRLQRVYCFPNNYSELWVFHKTMAGSGVSPWAKWTTLSIVDFKPSAALNMIDPVDGLEYVFFGDDVGNLYRLEGSGSGDAGSSNIRTSRLSALFKAPSSSDVFNFDGVVRYKKDKAFSLQVDLLIAGHTVDTQTVTISMPQVVRNVYGGNAYFNGAFYYGSLSGKFSREKFGFSLQGQEFQIRLTTEASVDFSISELRLLFQATTV